MLTIYPIKKKIPQNIFKPSTPVNQFKNRHSKGFVGQEKLICNPSGKSKSSCGPRKSSGVLLGQRILVLVCCFSENLQIWVIHTEYSSNPIFAFNSSNSPVFQQGSHISPTSAFPSSQIEPKAKKIQTSCTQIHFLASQASCVSGLMNFCKMLSTYRIRSWWQIAVDPQSNGHFPLHSTSLYP